MHDLFLACPNFSLLYLKSDPCGIPEDLSVCERCLADVADAPMPGSPPMAHMSLAYLDAFRAMVAERLDVVDRWVFPSQSAADYFLRVYDPDPARVEIIEHGSIIRLGRRPAEPDERLLRDEPLRVAFVGLGWSKKGLEAVNELAEAFRGTERRDPPVRPAEGGRVARAARARRLRQRVPARAAAPRGYPGGAAARRRTPRRSASS